MSFLRDTRWGRSWPGNLRSRRTELASSKDTPCFSSSRLWGVREHCDRSSKFFSPGAQKNRESRRKPAFFAFGLGAIGASIESRAVATEVVEGHALVLGWQTNDTGRWWIANDQAIRGASERGAFRLRLELAVVLIAAQRGVRGARRPTERPDSGLPRRSQLRNGAPPGQCNSVDLNGLEYLVLRSLGAPEHEYGMIALPADENGHPALPNDPALTVERWVERL